MKWRLYIKLFLVVCMLTTGFSFAQNIIWENYLQLGGDQIVKDIKKCDGGYILLGQGDNGSNDFSEIIKIDHTGQLLWRKALFVDSSIYSASFHFERVPGEHSYIVSGRKFFNSRDYLVKIDSQGNIIWENLYDYPIIYATTESFIVLPDKSIVTTGFNQTSSTYWDIIARRVDSLGDLMWEKEYHMVGTQYGFDIVEMMDGSFVISGRSNSDHLLLRIGFDGDLLDSVSFSPTFGNLWENGILLTPSNELIVDSYSSIGSNFEGELLGLDMENALIKWRKTFDKGIQSSAIINSDTNIFVHWIDSLINLTYSKLSPNADSLIWELKYSQGARNGRVIECQVFDENIIVAGELDTLGSDNYWFMEIDSVGNEWIPNPCAFSPPIAGFDFEYNYPLLSLMDTSYSGLKYLDTIYSWQWNTSAGQGGNTDSISVFFDSAISNTIDVELIVGNWYGCTDTINKTLIFEPNGIEEFKPFTISVYQNPTSDRLTIETNLNEPKTVQIFDIQGNNVKSEEFDDVSTTLDLIGLANGIYFYSVESKDETERGKFLIQH